MASDVADLRALLAGLDLPLRFEAPDTVVSGGSEIVAPGEPTRAELAARLAAVTAERDAEAAARYLAQKDRDTQVDALGHALATLRDSVLAALGAQPHEDAAEVAECVTRERDVLRAQLATATASVQQLRADVELATAQRDAEMCRADNAETERDEARAALVEVRRALGLRDDEDDIIGALQDEMAHRDDDEEVRRELHAANEESGPDAVRRVLQDLAVAKEQIAPLAAAFDAFRAAAHAAGWRDALATGEHLVAWVRRGALREALAVAQAEPGVPDGATQADFNAVECVGRIAAGIEKLMRGE